MHRHGACEVPGGVTQFMRGKVAHVVFAHTLRGNAAGGIAAGGVVGCSPSRCVRMVDVSLRLDGDTKDEGEKKTYVPSKQCLADMAAQGATTYMDLVFSELSLVVGRPASIVEMEGGVYSGPASMTVRGKLLIKSNDKFDHGAGDRRRQHGPYRFVGDAACGPLPGQQLTIRPHLCFQPPKIPDEGEAESQTGRPRPGIYERAQGRQGRARFSARVRLRARGPGKGLSGRPRRGRPRR